MTDIAELQARRAALVAARSSSTRAVQFGEDRVEYKSDKEMDAAIRFFDGEIARQGRRSNIFYFNTSKGF
jgi:hypothetical protein